MVKFDKLKCLSVHKEHTCAICSLSIPVYDDKKCMKKAEKTKVFVIFCFPQYIFDRLDFVSLLKISTLVYKQGIYSDNILRRPAVVNRDI